MSIDTLEIEMTRITRQHEYYELQLKYSENIIHNSRRTSYVLTYKLQFSVVLVISFVIGKALQLRR